VRAGLHDDLRVEGDSESRDFQAFYICEYQATVRLAGFLAGDRSVDKSNVCCISATTFGATG